MGPQPPLSNLKTTTRLVVPSPLEHGYPPPPLSFVGTVAQRYNAPPPPP